MLSDAVISHPGDWARAAGGLAMEGGLAGELQVHSVERRVAWMRRHLAYADQP
ncbi:hypothetical protein [Streptomyces bugieae]|uniref:Uncharacterized protein n=1 Tax=Streptomyces bugieae TaxID=3098223 RepID=A0ABU7NQW8_9ACTN|nr:hypothetical protein [Streptomyces sp. DSM 41528]